MWGLPNAFGIGKARGLSTSLSAWGCTFGIWKEQAIETTRPAAHARPFLAGMAALGFVLALAWELFVFPLADTIEADTFVVLACLFYGMVYGPVVVLALAFCWICSVKGWAAGNRSPSRLGAAMGVGGAAALLVAGFGWLNGGLVTGESFFPGRGGSFLLLGGALLLLQIAAEELLLRGWLLQTLREAFGQSAAIAVTALAFAMWNLAGAPLAVLPAFNLILLGFVLGVAADHFGGIAIPIAARLGWTITAELLLGINPNPGAGAFGALFDLDLTGGSLWGGTEAGLAHSLGTSAVLVAILLPLVQANRLRAAVLPA